MENQNFLDKIATLIIEKYSDNIINLIVVLPNKRAKIFLLEALKKQINANLFAPNIISIEDFIQNISNIRTIDPIELLFEFYEVYQEITAKNKQQGFEQFANWAKTLLQDFNEIDRYLLETDKILSYLKDIEDIKKWGQEVEKTPLLVRYIDFWKLLPKYYHALYKHLLNKKIGYQGLIYREAEANIKKFASKNTSKKWLFAGFNALNKAEEKIIQVLIDNDLAKIYWDADQTFVNDRYHDAGLFIRNFKNKWSHYKSHPFEQLVDDFSKEKKITIIGTPRTIGQAKITGSIIEQLLIENNNQNLEKVAVVLGEENLLLPMLYSLPANVGALNITMGYSSKNNPAQILVSKLFKLHVNAIKRNPTNYVFYIKDILDVLTHPLIEPYVNCSQLVQNIKEYNYTFITQNKIVTLNKNPNSLFNLLIAKWESGNLAVLETISNLLLLLKVNLKNDIEDEKLTKTFVYSIYKVINKLINYFSQNKTVIDVETLYAIYKQIIDLAEVSFEGEPLKGLQIMGVLESRVLDFETVIITSMNEGTFPAGKTSNSFIPYDVKKEYELPTYKEKDAIYTYHFYHLMQRAKNIYLIYNTENDGLDGGEMSRFITQLEVEKQKNHIISHIKINPELPLNAILPMVIKKSESIQDRLKEIATNGFSPSSLTSYIRNPMDFYFERVLKISDLEEVEEDVALNTLGTIIHKTLEELYKPYLNKYLTTEDIKTAINCVDKEVLTQFKIIYKEGEIKKGKNLLAFEVAKRNILNFLNLELKNISDGQSIKILFLEKSLDRILEHERLPYPIKIKGNVDRIEIRDNKLRIIDYKTGKVEAKNLTLKYWEDLTLDIKNEKIIQLLCYAFMYFPEYNNLPIEAGIISFKNLKAGFIPFNFIIDKNKESPIDLSTINNFLEELVTLIDKMLNKSYDFEEKTT